MATKKPLKIGSTGLPTEFASTDAIATQNGGVPSGGTTGQVLEKVDGTDYNMQWATPSTGGVSENLAIAYAIALG